MTCDENDEKKVTLQMATPGAESAVYDCLVSTGVSPFSSLAPFPLLLPLSLFFLFMPLPCRETAPFTFSYHFGCRLRD